MIRHPTMIKFLFRPNLRSLSIVNVIIGDFADHEPRCNPVV